MMICRTAAAMTAIAWAALPALAQTDPFYKGRTIKIVVGSGTGGGYDINARVLARHMGRHVPGRPTFVIQNQPGAGSVIMTNAVYNTAPRDGTVIGAAINGMPTAPLLTPKSVRFDVNKLIWIGSTNRDTQVSYASHTTPVKNFDELTRTELVVGATTPGTTQTDYPLVANAFLGTKYKVISGYKATKDIHIAMERGEVQAIGSNALLSLMALNSDWVKDKKINVLLAFSARRHPTLPDVPTVFELAKSDDDKRALRLMIGRLEYGRPFFLPPDVPEDRVATLRRAFNRTMGDREFISEARKAKLEISPMTGEEVAALITDLASTPKAIVDRVKAALKAGTTKR
ncbi:MAG: hypothetical protein RLZ98_1427 [Pseudomonadota bacterium]|jgi:tripartite-type tricarboxylate transporter receptor subunit TctC